MTTSKRFAFLLLTLCAGGHAAVAAAAPAAVKFATLAPDGSTWMKQLTELSKELEKETGGGLKLKFYAGGVAGDEKDVVKKMRIGQLHAAGFTGVGLGEIAPETRLLDAPWLFRDRHELEAVRTKLTKDFEAAIEKNGFLLLGWTDLGSVHVFSRGKVDGPDDMRKSKMWVWEGDPIASAAYKALGVSPVPLSVVDVMQSLQTGMIDAVYGPPLGVVALGWHAKLKHIYPVPMAESTGAVLVTKKYFDALPPEQQKALREVSSRHLKRLNELTHAENDKALETVSKNGLTLGARPGPDTLKKYEELGKAARKDMTGKLFPAELVLKLEKELAAFRARKTSKS